MTAPFLTALWVDFHLEREEPPGDPATGKQPLVLGVHTRGACDRRSAAVAAPCVPPPPLQLDTPASVHQGLGLCFPFLECLCLVCVSQRECRAQPPIRLWGELV